MTLLRAYVIEALLVYMKCVNIQSVSASKASSYVAYYITLKMLYFIMYIPQYSVYGTDLEYVLLYVDIRYNR